MTELEANYLSLNLAIFKNCDMSSKAVFTQKTIRLVKSNTLLMRTLSID